ncbi:MAG: outer membrane beta-barrel protein [Verrucomicrobiota bacterium]|jgi:hypothetical protein
MKLQRWTAALAAAGIVTVPSLLRAQTNTVLTALSSTTLSGYVDTSAEWNPGTGNQNLPPYSFNNANKADGFNLNVVDVAIDKPEDESQWASGYHVELWFGPDASQLGTSGSGEFAVRQAYVTLRTPIGNGIDWKIGVFDTIIGYESYSSPNNPNYSHSYGFTVEPTQHTGVLGTYQVNDVLSFSGGVADTFGPAINGRAFSPYPPGSPNESFKTYMASMTVTAPTNWGWMSGSTMSAGVVNGFNAGASQDGADRETSVYAGATLSTPLTALKLGASMDYEDLHNVPPTFGPSEGDGSIWAFALYSSFQATEKLSLNLRGEFVDDRADALSDWSDHLPTSMTAGKIYALTATAQYDLWKNVLSRVEFRWDHCDNGKIFGSNGSFITNTSSGPVTTNTGPSRKNAFMLAANIIYKF